MESEILLQKGRVVYINYGKEAEKYAILSDFVNTKKAIIDSPNGQLQRQEISIKRIEPTKFRVKEFDNTKCIKEYQSRFEKAVELLSQGGRGLQLKKQALRKNLKDFDRFKVMVLRRKLSKAIRTQLNKN